MAATAEERRARTLVWVALAIVYVGWGSTYLGIRVMVETIPPLLGAGLRFLIAGLLLLAWLRVRRGPAPLAVARRDLPAIVLVGCLLLVGGNGLVTVAERDVPSGLAALVVASVPLWLVGFRLLLRETVPARQLAGLTLGFGGVAILLLPGSRPEGATTAGLLLIVLASALWAVGTLTSARLAMPADAFGVGALELCAAGAVLLALSAATEDLGAFDPGTVSGRSLAGLLYLIGPGSIVTFSAYVWLLGEAPVSLVSTYAFVNPVVAVALGALLLDEAVTASVLAGAAVIVAAVWIVVRTPDRRPGRPIVRNERRPTAAARE